MTKPANDGLPLISVAEIIAFSSNPLIGEITLSTDKGDFTFAIKHKQAEELMIELAGFLDTE